MMDFQTKENWNFFRFFSIEILHKVSNQPACSTGFIKYNNKGNYFILL